MPVLIQHVQCYVRISARNCTFLFLQAVRALAYYWTDKTGQNYELSNDFPGTILHPPGKTYLYSLPVYEYPGLMKVCV